MQIDTVIYFQITDPKLYTYGVEHPMAAIENLTATTLRNIIGEMELDQTLTSRDIINTKMRAILDEATDPWGIKVNRVELKNIMPPKEIQNAMEKQMKAERERRESILQAEGQKQQPDPGGRGREAVRHPQGGRREAGRHPPRRGRASGRRACAPRARPRPSCRCRPALADSIKLLNSADPQRSGRQAQGARILREGRRRAGDEDHRAQRDPEPCGPCRQLQGPARGREEVNPAPRRRALRRSPL